MSFGWSGDILRVDLSAKRSWTEPTEPYARSFIGGRGINVKVVYDEVGDAVSPYDPENRICFGPGPLTGTLAPCSGRMKVTAMAPNGLLANSGIGGFIGAKIRHAGYDNLVIQGKSDEPVYLYLNDDSVEFRDARHLWGKDTQATQRAIKEEIGDSVEIMCIGQGGEKLVSFGCIVTGLGSGAGRSGFGAIMGSKNLKAVAVDGTREIRIAHPDEFVTAASEAQRMVREHPGMQKTAVQGMGEKQTLGLAHDYGQLTLGNWEVQDVSWEEFGGFPGADEFYSKYAVHQFGCFGCPVNHYHVFSVPGIGTGVIKCVGWAYFASNVWNRDREVMFHAAYLCNQYGLDWTAAGAAISFLMELYHRGIITEKDTDGIPMTRGSEQAIISTIDKIAKQEGFGELLRDGVWQAAKTIGSGAEECAMVVKGAEIEPYDIRAYKSEALVAALAAGTIVEGLSIEFSYIGDPETVERFVEETYGSKEYAVQTSYEGKPLIVWDYENRLMTGDMLGLCHWIFPRRNPSFEIPAKLFSLATGREASWEQLSFAAQRAKTLERAFDVRRGVTRADDTLPKRMFDTSVPGGRFDGERLDRQAFDKMLDEYYALRGWDERGLPTEETFKRYGLASEWRALEEAISGKKKPAKEIVTDD
jgi:aldehyde:ferredoxin oxidoreductase